MQGHLKQKNREHSIMRKNDNVTISETLQQATSIVVPPQTGAALPHQHTGYVAGVDIGGTSLRMALADMSGNIVAKTSSSTTGVRDPEFVIQRMYEGLKQMLSEIAVSADALKSIAIGVPGVTNVDEGTVIATSYLMGWQNVPLRALVEDELQIAAAIDNDVNLAAIGESWAGAAKNVQDFVFLAIGTGLGAGIVLNGHPYRGNNWSAGEIGYMPIPGTSAGPKQDGEPGALESAIGGEGIRLQWEKRRDAALPKNLNATEIFDFALNGNSLAETILQESAALLAQTIYTISLILDCPLFVLGGSVGMHPALCDATQKILDQWKRHGRLGVVRSALGGDAQLMGAIRIALDTANVNRKRSNNWPNLD
jgi:glucokinase